MPLFKVRAPDGRILTIQAADAASATRQAANAPPPVNPITGAAMTAIRAMPFQGELMGGLSAGLMSLDDLAEHRPMDFAGHWAQVRAAQQQAETAFRQDHPIGGNVAAGGGQAAAMLPLIARAPAELAARAPQAAAAVSNGLRAAMARQLQAAPRNAFAGGALSSFQAASGTGTLPQRVDRARNAFAPGAVLGMAIPTAAEPADWLLRRLPRPVWGDPLHPFVQEAVAAGDKGIDQALTRMVLNQTGQAEPPPLTTPAERLAHLTTAVDDARRQLAGQARLGLDSMEPLQNAVLLRARGPSQAGPNAARQFALTVDRHIGQPYADGDLQGEMLLRKLDLLRGMSRNLAMQGPNEAAVGRSLDALSHDIEDEVSARNSGYQPARLSVLMLDNARDRIASASRLAGRADGSFDAAHLGAVLPDMEDPDQALDSGMADELLHNFVQRVKAMKPFDDLPGAFDPGPDPGNATLAPTPSAPSPDTSDAASGAADAASGGGVVTPGPWGARPGSD